MSEVIRRPGLPETVRFPGSRVSLTGTEAEIGIVLGQLEEHGMLAKIPPPPRETRLPGVYRVVADLVPINQVAELAAEPAPSWWTPRRVGYAAAAAASVLALCGAAVFVALSWLAANWAPIAVVGVVLLLVAGIGGGRTFTFSGRGRIE